MADIQFDITLDLVEKYVPAENVTVVQEDFQSVKFFFTILNREQPVDLTGATDIVVSFVKPDGHLVLQNDATLVNGKVELVANPQAFTYVGKTYFQVQYKIGSSIYNTRQAFLWVEKGHTSCQTVSSTDFAPMLDQAIQAGQMLSGIDLQALIDSKVTAENAQADVDALELRVGALEVTIVGLDLRVDALEAGQATQDTAISGLQSTQAAHTTKLGGLETSVSEHEIEITSLQGSQTTQDTKIASLESGQADLTLRVTSVEGNVTTVVSEVDALQLASADHETRIEGLEANMPNLSPIEADIATLKAKDVEQDGRIGANETAVTGLQTKNTQQDTAIAGNADEIGKLQAEQTTQNNRLTAIENKNASQDSAIGDIQTKDVQQDAAISALQSSQSTQDTDIATIKTKNTQQDTAISANSTSIAAIDTKVDTNKAEQDAVNAGVTGSLSNHSTRIEALEADATVDDARITNLEGDNTSNKNRISNVEGAIGVLNSDINDLQGSDAIQNADIVAIKTKNTQQDGLIADNSAAIATNKADADSKITGLSTRVGTVEGDIAGLKTKDTQQDTRMTAIENKDAAQDTRMTTIEGVNTTQNTRLGTLETDNTSNKSRLITLETDNTSNKSRLTAVENKNTSQDTAINGKVNTADIYTSFVQASGRSVYLATGTDLDTIESSGYYAGNALLNAPYSSGVFYIEVQQHTVAGYAMQKATYLNATNNEQFTRRKRDTNGWTPWVKIANEQDVIKKTEIYTDLTSADGGVSFLVPANGALLTEITNRGRGLRTFYCPGNATDTPTTLSVRGISNIQATNIGYVIAMDTNNNMWTNFINGSTWTGWRDASGKVKDGRAELTLTADATNANSGYLPYAIRRGNTVTVRMEITRNAGSTGTTVCTLPVDMRPAETLSHTISANDGSPIGVNISWNGNVDVYTNGKQFKFVSTYVVN